MFWKAVTYEIDDGDPESGPGKSYEEVWAVCRAASAAEARILLSIFLSRQKTSSLDKEIVEAAQEEYEEFLGYLADTYQ